LRGGAQSELDRGGILLNVRSTLKRTTAPSAHDKGRQERILDAAEQAFADSGFEGASLRRIVAEAGENLATVYYHFKSKEGLMEAVVRRRFGPLNARHFELVGAVMAERGGKRPPVENLLRAMLSPGLGLAASDAPESAVVMRLIGRMLTEPNLAIQDLLRSQCEEVRELYQDAFHQACPWLEPDALRWRIETVWGALAFILCNSRKLSATGRGERVACDADSILAHLVPFFAAGFKTRTGTAPVAGRPPRAVNGAKRAALPLIE
jgi:AcrR family transcriptional regulator